MNLYKRKRNKISDIEEKDERNSSNFSDIKNDEVLIIQTIKRKVKNKDNKITFSSKEMTTTDQNENTSNQKNSSTTYNINFSPDSFRFQHKSPYSFYHFLWQLGGQMVFGVEEHGGANAILAVGAVKHVNVDATFTTAPESLVVG